MSILHNKFLDTALATGLADFPINPMDQRVRELQAYYQVEGQMVPALSTALFLIDCGAEIMPSKHINMDKKCLSDVSFPRICEYSSEKKGPAVFRGFGTRAHDPVL